MNSVQIGRADLAPSSFSSLLSSKPTQTTHKSWEVNPANQPSREVPVLPAAGALKPRPRTPAAVPLLITSCIRFTTSPLGGMAQIRRRIRDTVRPEDAGLVIDNRSSRDWRLLAVCESGIERRRIHEG